MIRPCPNSILCENQNPFSNLSSEEPEVFYYYAFAYCCDGKIIEATSTVSYWDAIDALQRIMARSCPPTGPGGECWKDVYLYCATAGCPDGSKLMQFCAPTSQEDVNWVAADYALRLLPYCEEKDSSLFRADCACPDGVTDPHTVYSDVSQEVAEAICKKIPKDCGASQFSSAQCCTVTCPDGTEFTYCIPAGTIYGKTQEEADATAHALACTRAAQVRVCLSAPIICCCVGDSYLSEIAATGLDLRTSVQWDVGAGLPPGLTYYADVGNRLVITGTPTTAGNYSVVITAWTSANSYAKKTINFTVLNITTEEIDPYYVGVEYSFQLEAEGGTPANHRWRIVSGSLPSGLSLSETGLISGTPTGADAGTAVQFELVDTGCEALEKSYFPPKVSLQTFSQTIIKTWRGWPGYGTNTLYRRVTYSGDKSQTAFPNYNFNSLDYIQCAGAKYVFGGYDEIDIYGNVTSRHTKLLYTMCNSGGDWPQLRELDIQSETQYIMAHPIGMPYLLGYCWDDDPTSCDECNTDEARDPENWEFYQDRAHFGPYDSPWSMLPNNALDESSATETVWIQSGQGKAFSMALWPGRESFPYNSILGTLTAAHNFVRIFSEGTWTRELSVPYTDLDAENTKVVSTGTISVAENQPNYRTWLYNTVTNKQSRITQVIYRLNCTGLVAGKSYRANVRLYYSTGGYVTVSNTFEASSATHVIQAGVPTPPANGTITVKQATIVSV